jgi:hypothetical protein
MVGQNSNLSAYGYDMVVATTQGSINGAIKNYFTETDFAPTPVTVIYVDFRGVRSAYTLAEFFTFSSQTLGRSIDPFLVPAWDGTGSAPQDVADLQNLGLLGGFTATIGAPAGYYLPSMMPNPVILKTGTQSVIFTLLCSSFQVIGFNYPAYVNQSQPTDADPWLFAANINLATITDSSNLPPNVQAQVNALTAQNIDFSVQKLIFDLDNALLADTPAISGIPAYSSVVELLNQYFLGAYFTQMKAAGQPILNYTITQSNADAGTLPITAVEAYADAMVDANGNPLPTPTLPQQNGATLNYLCSTNGDALPAGRQFNWNWLELTDVSNYQGAVAISREALAAWLGRVFTAPFSPTAEYLSMTQVTPTFYGGPSDTMGGICPNYKFELVYKTDLTFPAEGPTIIQYSYQSPSATQQSNDGGEVQVSAKFDLEVNFVNTTATNGNPAAAIVVSRHSVTTMTASLGGQSDTSNVIDVLVTQTYLLGITDTGSLVYTMTSKTTDLSQPNTVWISNPTAVCTFVGFWAEFAQNPQFILNNLTSEALQIFVFPGGNSFAFKSVAFSDAQDLVSPITYQNQ